MTLTIIDECTHNKTFSVYDKPNGTIKILEDADFHLNPRVHADPLSRASSSATDGSLAEILSSAQGQSPPPSFNKESKSGEPSDFFEENGGSK